jgi:peptidyl-prolyl cis-trans isomerase B (cyclophilin B)
MKKVTFLSFILLFFFAMELDAQKQTKVLIHTDYGDIKLALYNDTPKHRDNFIKLANEGFYNGSIFHRIIKDFMIQGGGAPAGKAEKDYRIPAEILPNHIHKKGALAAARMGDQVNPKKESSGSQFYIVQGIHGAPHLNGGYTVFGEVLEGLDVVDKIAAVQTGAMDKPVKDVKMTVKIVQ